jgi:pimeloyl-ACP methyl ester carboxylesterase
MRRIDSDFISDGTRCAGWLYLPDGDAAPPVVVMAHGIAAERTFRLPAFAERFVERGFAVFLFDYRNFGDSDGQPRNLINPGRHVQDWNAAISHVRSLGEVDGDRLALWGTSFAGGHVLVAAAKNPSVSAVVSQVPFVDSIASALIFSPMHVLKGSYHTMRDFLRILTFRSPHCIPVVADPESFALMNTPDSRPGYMALVPEDSAWRNECPARVVMTLLLYRPITSAGKIKCPVLIICAENDSLIPARAVARTGRNIDNCELVNLPVGHFDVYYGDVFEQVVRIEGDFLHRILHRG